MKNNFKITVIIAIITVIGLSMSVCGTNEKEQTSDITKKRYETIPIIDNNINNPTGNNTIQGLIYSCYDNNFYYYVFILGYVNFVPLAYRDAILYNGRTPITISYTKTATIENSIKNAITTTVENTITKTHNETYNGKIEAGLMYKIFGAKITANVNYEYGRINTDICSSSNTIETTKKRIEEESDNITATIGNNNEPFGKYRYSLFASTDVYYIVKVRKNDFILINEKIDVCVRPQTYAWGIDYEPDPAGTFKKTDMDNLLVIPHVNYSTLPKPTEYNYIIFENNENPVYSPGLGGTGNNEIDASPPSPGGISPVTVEPDDNYVFGN